MVTVRAATASDVAAITAVVTAAYTPYVEQIGVRPGPLRADYDAALRDRDVRVAVDEAGGVIGVLVLEHADDHLLVENVAVVPASQGTGVGRLLLDLAEQTARDLGLAEVRLYTHRLMARNIALYLSRGYAETHRETQGGFDRVFMTKRL